MVEKPTPTENSPVDFSCTSTLMMVLSGALPGTLVMFDLLEEVEVLDALLGAVQLRGVERVALDEPELAADHLVERAQIAGDVDALDIDPRPFLDVVGDVDRVRVGDCAVTCGWMSTKA